MRLRLLVHYRIACYAPVTCRAMESATNTNFLVGTGRIVGSSPTASDGGSVYEPQDAQILSLTVRYRRSLVESDIAFSQLALGGVIPKNESAMAKSSRNSLSTTTHPSVKRRRAKRRKYIRASKARLIDAGAAPSHCAPKPPIRQTAEKQKAHQDGVSRSTEARERRRV